EPSYEERISFAVEHSQHLIGEKGERVAVPELRKHIAWYTRGMPQSAELRHKINSICSAADLYETLSSYLESINS
ncbi:MAG TPA: tRNA-dihydrouridine synthase, partial [Chroococcales cyanobacterium]